MSRQKFCQEKFEYYRKMNQWVVIAVSCLSVAYYLSDCYLIGRMTLETFPSRAMILALLPFFIWLNAHTKDYRIMVPASYLMGHAIMWGTILACRHLDNLAFACVGFFIIQFIFLVLGIGAPIPIAAVGHGLLFLDIAIGNTFLHYPDYNMMFLLGVPLYLGIVVFDIAIERTFGDQLRMKCQLEDHLKHDHLTGAYNRNIMASLADGEQHILDTKGKKLAVAMYDLDHFKLINDNYGHTIGDEVLVEVTEAVKSKLHEDEHLIRWGGEEFIIVMRSSEEDFYAHAEEVRQAVEEKKLLDGQVTISIGVALYDGGNYEKAVKNADIALYQAKNSGRNRVAVYQ